MNTKKKRLLAIAIVAVVVIACGNDQPDTRDMIEKYIDRAGLWLFFSCAVAGALS